MATREGIYVGGHEIVERYVGSRLVWEKEKWIFVGSFRDLSLRTISSDFLVLNTTNNDGTFDDKYRNRSKITKTKINIKPKNGVKRVVYARYAYTHYSNDYSNDYLNNYSGGINKAPGLYIEFTDINQRDEFKRNFTNGDSLDIYIKLSGGH